MLCFWFCCTFLQATIFIISVSSQENANKSLSLSDKSEIYADVLANITKVNDELRGVIGYFENFKKADKVKGSSKQVDELVEKLIQKLEGKDVKLDVFSTLSSDVSNEVTDLKDLIESNEDDTDIIVLTKNDIELNEPNSKDSIETHDDKSRVAKYLNKLLGYQSSCPHGCNDEKEKKKTKNIDFSVAEDDVKDKLLNVLLNIKSNHALRIEEHEKLIKKHEAKTLRLRRAYGDACMKLVLKKCNKAALVQYFIERMNEKRATKEIYRAQVVGRAWPGSRRKTYADQTGDILVKGQVKSTRNKRACMTRLMNVEEAKEALKETLADLVALGLCNDMCETAFNKCGSDSCREEFYGTEKNQDRKRSKTDFTRQGHLTVACLPETSQKKNLKLRNNNKDPPVSKHEHEINILRDKFEKACQVATAEKCGKACEYSYTQACISTTCSEKTTNQFAKSCAKNCKKAYEPKVESESDSSDSDDSDSDSSSD